MKFEDVFGVQFGDVVSGSGVSVHLQGLNPKAKGRAMSVEISHQPWGVDLLLDTYFSLDTIGFTNAWKALDYTNKYFPTHWWWRNRIRNFARENKMAIFAWPSLHKMKRGGFPQAPGLLPGDTFYATFRMENGQGVCLECSLPAGYTGQPVAGFGQRNTDDELMYYCRY